MTEKKSEETIKKESKEQPLQVNTEEQRKAPVGLPVGPINGKTGSGPLPDIGTEGSLH
jgi:hypothetical protein